MKTAPNIEKQQQIKKSTTRRQFMRQTGATVFSLTLVDLAFTLSTANADDGYDCSAYESGDDSCTKPGDKDEGCDEGSGQIADWSSNPDQGCQKKGADTAGDPDGGCNYSNPTLVDDASCSPQGPNLTDASCDPPHSHNESDQGGF